MIPCGNRQVGSGSVARAGVGTTVRIVGSVMCAGEAQAQWQISVEVEHPSASIQQSSNSQAALLTNHKMNIKRLRRPLDMEVVDFIFSVI